MDRKLTEAGHQTLVICWAKKSCLAGRVELDLLMHIPNGEKRDAATASKLKRLGVRAGVPDLFLPVMRSGYGGLWIEMKTDSGRLGDQQEEWHKRLELAGHKVVTCWSWQEAVETIKGYLGGEWASVEMDQMVQRIAGADSAEARK